MSAGSALKGVKVGSTDYQFDYTYLANKPTIPSIPSTSGASEGDVLTIGSGGDPEWATPTSGGSTELPDSSEVVGGEALMVSNCSDGHLEWRFPLPTCSTDGWVLTSGNDGPEWADPATLTS